MNRPANGDPRRLGSLLGVAGVRALRPGAAPAPAGLGSVNIGQLLAPTLRHRWLVLGVTLALGAAAVAYVKWELPRYKASATIRLDDVRREVTVGIEAPEKLTGPMTNPVVSEIQRLRSRELIGRVVDSLTLRLRPDFRHFTANLLQNLQIADAVLPDTLQMSFGRDTVRAMGTRLRGKAAYGQPLRLQGLTFTLTAKPDVDDATWLVTARESAIDAVLEKLVVYPRVFSDVVDVTYTGYRPTVVRRVVNGVVRSFVDAGVEEATAAARKRRQFLETQMQQNDSLLSVAQANLITFRRRAQVFSTPALIDAQQREVLGLEQRWAELRANRHAYQRLLDGLEAVRAGKQRSEAVRALASSPELAANPAIAALVQQLLAHERVLDSLRTGPWRSAATDPDVQRVQALVTGTQENMLALVKGYLGSIDVRSDALNQVRTRTTASLLAMPSVDAEDARLSRRVTTYANLGEYLRGEHQKARIAEGAAVGRAVVMDTAYTPYKPVAQFRLLKVIVGALVGLLLSMLIAAILERRNTSIRRRVDLEETSHIPVLGLVPPLDSDAGRAKDSRTYSGSLRGLMGRMNGSERGARALPSNGVDAYRMLRANVTSAGSHGAPRSIVVTSAAPGDGKTTTAVNLALAFAREGRRVLLIDCDLRRAAIHRMFNVRRSPGLSQVLDGRSPLLPSIQPSGVDGLFLLTAGDSQRNGAHLLEGAPFRRTLEQLRMAFDLIVIDSAPVLAVADAAVISSLVDGVLVVVRAGVTDRSDAAQVIRQLSTAGAVVLGGVINDPAGHLVERQDYYYGDYAST